jgi:hypothetical protein
VASDAADRSGAKLGPNGTAQLRDAAANENKTLPVHRWVPWIAGFSAQFVEDAIEAYLPAHSRGRRRVIDPFAGVATTQVEALKAGCDTTGYEINAFAVLAARAKLNCIDVRLDDFRAEVAAFRSAMQRFEADIDRRWSEAGEDGIGSALQNVVSVRPEHFRSRIPLFSPPVEAKFLYALDRSVCLLEPDRALFRSALGATMISFSNYSYEPSLSSRPGAGKALIENASVAEPVCSKLEEMLDDMQFIEAHWGEAWRQRQREIVHGSYFESRLPPGSVSLLVTSPPYMNNYHYVRNTRPQLHWLGLTDGPQALREYEQTSFGKFWQTVRQSQPIGLQVDIPSLRAKIEGLRETNVGRGPYGGPGWANYVATYFNDCDRFLGSIRRQLRPGAHALIVVGNSIIQGIEFKVDHLLADMAARRRLQVEDIRIVRTKRVGSSIIDSSVRNGGGDGHRRKTHLYDAAVVLRR